jgi:hypothetical protein
MDLKKLNDALLNGELPPELDFKIKKDFEIDINMLKYNAFYRSYDFFESKFPAGYQCIPGFNKIIESISEKAEENQISPLQEISARQNNDENKNA